MWKSGNTVLCVMGQFKWAMTCQGGSVCECGGLACVWCIGMDHECVRQLAMWVGWVVYVRCGCVVGSRLVAVVVVVG